MWVKILVIIVLLAIIGSLGSGLYYLIRDGGSTKRAVKALSWRIGLSVALFLLLLVLSFTGFIQPHGLLPLPDQG